MKSFVPGRYDRHRGGNCIPPPHKQERKTNVLVSYTQDKQPT